MSNQKVTVTIKKRPKVERPRPAAAEEARWGPFSRPEDDDPTKPKPQLILLDSSAWLHTEAVNGLFDDTYKTGIMAYLTAYADMLGSNPVQLASAPEADVNEAWRGWLEGSIFKTMDLGYRQADKAWPMPLTVSDYLVASIKLGTKTSALDADTPYWVEGKTPQERLDAVPDTPENEEKRAALQSEIDESDMPLDIICPDDIDEEKFRWYVHEEQDIRPLFATPGIFKSLTGADLKSLEFNGGYHFEPFKLSGPDYLVIRAPEDGSIPTYADAQELSTGVPRQVATNKVKIWLVPRAWRVDLAYLKIYGIRGSGGSPGTYDAPSMGSISFLMPAITNALVLQGNIHADFLATPAPVLSRIYVTSEGPWKRDDLTFDNYLRLCSRVGWYFNFVDTDDDTNLWGRYNATATIEVANTPAGRLVGAIETKPGSPSHRYLVYRKVVLEVNEDDLEVYSGVFDDPRYVSNELVDSDYNNNQMHLCQFTTYNPDDAPISFFGAWPQMLPGEFCAGGYPYFMEMKDGLAVHDGLPDS